MSNQGALQPIYEPMQDCIQSSVVFTERESLCLSHAMQHKTVAQMAEHLGICKQTVYFYLTTAGHKLELLAKQALL